MKVFVDSVGCRVNQSEIEIIARQFRQAGHEIVSEAGQADLVVVNTCMVTAEAASDSRGKIRQAKRQGGGEIIATGCWATLEPDRAAAITGVKRVVPNGDKDHLVADELHLPREVFDLEPMDRQPLPGLRQRTRAFIKVQDGCNNRCTFCITTVARGISRSRTIEAVLSDIRAAVHGGAQEVVLTGVHLGSWGRDFENGGKIKDLVHAILAETDVTRLRLSSLEPWDLDEDFFELWADSRMCRHLHLPLQSGSAMILRRMARKVTPESFARLVNTARRKVPGMAISTDVIVGFPGETEEYFNESLEYVRQMDFAAGHVFTYSPRPGTAAARFPDQIPLNLRKERNARMRAVFSEANKRYREGFVGTEAAVLWETTEALGPQGWRLGGLTDNYLRIMASADTPRWNLMDRVRLESLTDEGLSGTIIG